MQVRDASLCAGIVVVTPDIRGEGEKRSGTKRAREKGLAASKNSPPSLPPVLHLFSFSSIRAYQSPPLLLFFSSSPPAFLSFLEERHDATATPTFRTLFTSRTTNDPGRGSFLSSSSLSPAAARDASAPDR